MPARPNVQIVCAAAAVVVYVECPSTGNLFALPAGGKPKPGHVVFLTVHAN